jgi:hypothetical protein
MGHDRVCALHRGDRARRPCLPRRAVRFLAVEAGIRQFIDVSTGLPGVQAGCDIAQPIDPACRVVYVDHDRCKSGCAQAAERVPAGSAWFRGRGAGPGGAGVTARNAWASMDKVACRYQARYLRTW